MSISLERVKKHKNYLFVNRGTDAVPEWIRVRTSTDFAVAFNAETETFDYIADENPSDEIKSYKPSIAQTQTAYINDFVFDYVFDYAYELKTGASTVTRGMLVFQQKGETEGSNKAWMFDMTITIDTYDVVAGTLTYTMGVRGTIERGEAVVDENGVPTFTTEGTVAAGSAAYTMEHTDTFAPYENNEPEFTDTEQNEEDKIYV